MNYFLTLIILGLCGGGYYEYNLLQQKSTAEEQQLTDLGSKVSKLEADNKTLSNDKAQLTKSVTDAQAEVADLTKQLQAAQNALNAAKQQAAPNPTAAAPPAAMTAPPTPATNNLGTITTLGGKIYPNCQLLKVDGDGIVVNYSDGITKILFGLLPLDLQKRFGYDAHQAAALTEAQIQFQEEQRKAADQSQATGN